MLGQTDKLPLGTRDAVHVPYIVACAICPVEPGDWVKFTTRSGTGVTKCSKEEADGIIDPFINGPITSDFFMVLIKPGKSGPVKHNFTMPFDNSYIERDDDDVCSRMGC